MSVTRILIVEDETLVAHDLQKKLIRAGYQVLEQANNGEEAIEKALAHHPSLILMDVHLQGVLDGIETAAQIRSRLDIPVVYLTAYADDQTLERAR